MKKAVASSIVAVMLTSNLTPTFAKADDVSQGVPKDEVKIELYQENIPEENKEESITEEAIVESEEEAVTEEVIVESEEGAVTEEVIVESEEEAVTEEVKTKELVKVEEKEGIPEPANVTNEFDVDNFTDLQTAVNKEGAIINLTGNIMLQKSLM